MLRTVRTVFTKGVIYTMGQDRKASNDSHYQNWKEVPASLSHLSSPSPTAWRMPLGLSPSYEYLNNSQETQLKLVFQSSGSFQCIWKQYFIE
jgi:hypothetical protein